MLKFIYCVVILLMTHSLYAQDSMHIQLSNDSITIPNIAGLDIEVDMSFSDIPIKELVRILGNSSGLNVTIDKEINYSVNANFNQVKAIDVINFLCSRYKLKFEYYGNIIHLKKEETDNTKLLIELINDSTISYNVRNAEFNTFFQELTNKVKFNFILSPELSKIQINAFAKNISITDALEQISLANQLIISKKSNKLYAVSPMPVSKGNNLINQFNITPSNIKLAVKDDLITADINNADIKDVIKELSKQSVNTFSLLSDLEGKINLQSNYNSFTGFLNKLFNGTAYTYRIEENTVFVGERKLPGIKTCEMLKLNNRRVDSLSYSLPTQIKQDLVIQEFPEQNSLIVWGDADVIDSFKKTLRQIDVVVPVILIDVMIVDAGKNFEIETGLEAGLGTSATSTSGEINPGLDISMNSESVNNLLGRIGLTNLGKVSPNFYLNLKAMETDGIIEIRSTPQLSTLNGHSAVMTIGETQYYKEETSNLYGSQNPQLQTQYQYKPVEANMTVNIKPFVTGNGQVSLTISVEQSEFTDRIDEFAPPGLESRKFQSMIRVKNQEMILLGGLEENVNSSSRSGWPLLSKIPVLNWIFTNKKKVNNKSHLNIFIKPTVIY